MSAPEKSMHRHISPRQMISVLQCDNTSSHVSPANTKTWHFSGTAVTLVHRKREKEGERSMDSSSVGLSVQEHRQRFSDLNDHLSSLELSDIISLSGLPESTLPIAPPGERDHGKETSFSSKRRRKKSSRETHDEPHSEANHFAFPFLFFSQFYLLHVFSWRWTG